MKRYEIGVVGLSVMGRGLALNLAEKGFAVAGYNLEPELTDAFVAEAGRSGFEAAGFAGLAAFCQALHKPRKILVMIKAGRPVDEVVDSLMLHLEAGDIIVDGGNSNFRDTMRRIETCKEAGVHFVGMGVSGGEEGARRGPALMPGGDPEACGKLLPYLQAISEKVAGKPCCSYIGGSGAGHFLKMVHNGIEYGDMELICEAYYLLKKMLGLGAPEIGEIFAQWNRGELDSYLMEISAKVLQETDLETGKPLVDVILGKAGSKGTGLWTVQESLELGVAVPTISQAVFARLISAGEKLERSFGSLRTCAGKLSVEQVRRALYASKICSYAQGYAILQKASQAYGWDMDLQEISLLFRGGCIIRASFLNRIAAAYAENEKLANLISDPYFSGKIDEYQEDWRAVAAGACLNAVAAPGMTASLAYFDSLSDPEGPLNLLQAQRDCFGAHTFQRVDREGVFHHQW